MGGWVQLASHFLRILKDNPRQITLRPYIRIGSRRPTIHFSKVSPKIYDEGGRSEVET